MLLLWSATVQFVGAYSYSLTGWTEQWWNEKRDNNPDKDSLWQWTRPQIAYHIANFQSERSLKKMRPALSPMGVPTATRFALNAMAFTPAG